MSRETKIKRYLNEHVPPAVQEDIKTAMGWSQAQWSWHLNNPTKWTSEKVVAFSAELGMSWRTMVIDYDLGADVLSPVANA